ncbi:hypothetical protein G7046_g4257 [Stylonectria norvegica]|nr:hypothetical protein G7046_g4257 [Stylonectria norvegica]
MASFNIFGERKMASIFLMLACAVLSILADDGVTTSSEKNAPEWAADNSMQLTQSTGHGDWRPIQYTVIPLTENLGLNESGRYREIVQIDGNMIAADSSNYNKINQPTDVAYLSCDEPTDASFISPSKMLNDLMQIRPKAIVLYSTTNNWCNLNRDGDADLSYTSILTMADAGEAAQALGYLNGTTNGSVVKVSITGNTTSNDTDANDNKGGNNSQVAMSILYGITGLITLLFLVIIATGAVRAHRYPERYGPRRALGGRPRQSRAKGLARAVLETIPIVKFGDREQTKPDPELDLENTDAATDSHDIPMQRTASVLTEQQQRPGTAAVKATDQDAVSSVARTSQAADGADKTEEEHLGCSICTEDFKVGEDVRVLPCHHQFHPVCIDPWLINVSGTCPLCRFDLRPSKRNAAEGEESTDVGEGSTAIGDNALPPPLALEGDDHADTNGPHRNRFSRLFDAQRLRQATAEEQMEALRQMRVETNAAASQTTAAETNEVERQATEGESGGPRARLADKLKDKFRIRTRAQPAERRST